MPVAKSEAKQVGEFEFVISRVFDAPLDGMEKPGLTRTAAQMVGAAGL